MNIPPVTDPAPGRSATRRANEVELRREKLAVLCALDRARLRLALAPTPRPPSAVADGLDLLLGAARRLPGRAGKWARRAGLLADAVRFFTR